MRSIVYGLFLLVSCCAASAQTTVNVTKPLRVGNVTVRSQIGINGEIDRIGSYTVLTDPSGRISKIGEWIVRTDTEGRISQIGSMNVFYEGDRISRIGSMNVFYRR